MLKCFKHWTVYHEKVTLQKWHIYSWTGWSCTLQTGAAQELATAKGQALLPFHWWSLLLLAGFQSCITFATALAPSGSFSEKASDTQRPFHTARSTNWLHEGPNKCHSWVMGEENSTQPAGRGKENSDKLIHNLWILTYRLGLHWGDFFFLKKDNRAGNLAQQ